ncbi:MAG: small multi-drug export protein [Clostridia bacterium]|nr:small multi-drug export protein [Clostridia bacterium]
MLEVIQGFPYFVKCIITGLVGMMPIIEIRGAIPIGVTLGLDYTTSYICSFIGNIIPIFFIVKYIRPLFDFFGRWKFFKKIIDYATEKATKNIQNNTKLQNFVALGLFLFVAIPLPTTGAWVGSLIANFLDLPLKKAFWPLAAGVAVAGFIVLVATGSVVALAF